jgi:hypothetical protein
MLAHQVTPCEHLQYSPHVHAEDRVYVVFSTKIPQRHLGHWAEAARGNWSVEFESASNSPGGLRLRAHSLGR